MIPPSPSADPLPPVDLHLGAHRTGARAVGALLAQGREALARRGTTAWGVPQTRDGRLAGLIGASGGDPERARGRLALRRAEMAAEGRPRLLISEPRLLGSLRECLSLARLYPTASTRLGRLSRALGPVDRVTLALRPLDGWWEGVIADRVRLGAARPRADALDAISEGRRGWRAIIETVADAFPEARLEVWLDPAPAPLARSITGLAFDDAPRPPARTAEAVFDATQRGRLRMLHRSDMIWLRDGAGGLACYRGGGEAGREDGDEGHRSEGRVDRAGRGGASRTAPR